MIFTSYRVSRPTIPGVGDQKRKDKRTEHSRYVQYLIPPIQFNAGKRTDA